MKRSSMIVVIGMWSSFSVSIVCQQTLPECPCVREQEQCSDNVLDLNDDAINQLVFDARETGVLSEKLEVPRVVWLSMIANWMVMKYLQCAQWMRGCWETIKV